MVSTGEPTPVQWREADIAGASSFELSLWRGGTELKTIEYCLNAKSTPFIWTPSEFLESGNDYALGMKWPWYEQDVVKASNFQLYNLR